MINSHDLKGGAARAAYRLHRGLLDNGVESNILVATKSSDDANVIGPASKLAKLYEMLKIEIEPWALKNLRGGATRYFSPAWFRHTRLNKTLAITDPDIVHLHWPCASMLTVAQLSCISQPMVWTLHDMWPFTGGCHYSEGCDNYKVECGKCPQLNRNGNHDLSRSIWEKKSTVYKDLDLRIVAPSQWMASCARESSLLKGKNIEVIPNGIDLKVFKPVDQRMAREILGLPKEKKLILFGAMNATSDSRKGYQFLLEGLQSMEGMVDVELVVFGASEPKTPPELNLPIRYVGQIYDEVSLAVLYSSVDVMVVPSTQDNLPNTVVEALACGTPCVGFRIGGLVDLIEHKKSGYLADSFDVFDLVEGIRWCIEQNDGSLSREARLKAERDYDINQTAMKYAALYNKLRPVRSLERT